MTMGDTPAKAGLARKMALENECHTCRIYLVLVQGRSGKIKSPTKPRGTVLQVPF